MTEPCVEFGCEYFGGFECPATRILERNPDFKCEGPVMCSRCHYQKEDGTKTCSCGNDSENHYCNFMYHSGFKRREG